MDKWAESWISQFLKPVFLILSVVYERNTQGNLHATSQKTGHEPHYIKSNLSEEEVQPCHWTPHKLLCLSHSQHAGICSQLFSYSTTVQLPFVNTPLICLEHAVGYTFSPRTILPLRRLRVVWPPTLPHWLQCLEYAGVCVCDLR